MKKHLDIKHEGTLGDTDRKRMSFDENSISHIMSILTDLYSDPVMAVIREYSTNALDAHQEAGNPDPIEVTLPTALNPIFTVKDQGIGMNEENIMEHFSKYGWSSKRETDEQVGMLGLGCKCALTLVSQFTIITVKDGTRLTVLVTRDPDGAGVVQIVEKEPNVEEPNGVQISIPVGMERNEFASKAQQFFSFWEKGQVLLNGSEPKPVLEADSENSYWLDPDVVVSRGLDKSYIVMGNVPYPIVSETDEERDRRRRGYTDRNSFAGLAWGWNVVARVPIGAIDFTPSREELHLTNRTKDVVETLKTFVQERLGWCAQKDIDAAPTHVDARARANVWEELSDVNHYRGARPFSRYTYKGEAIPLQGFKIADDNKTFLWSWGSYADPARALDAASQRLTTIQEWMLQRNEYFILTGWKGRGIPRNLKYAVAGFHKELRKWAEACGQNAWQDVPTALIVCKTNPVGKWSQGSYVKITEKDLEPYYPPTTATAKGKKGVVNFRLVSPNGDAVQEDLKFPFRNKTVIWMPCKLNPSGYGPYAAYSKGLLTLLGKDGTKFGAKKDSEIVLVLLRKREVEPFLAKHKHHKKLYDHFSFFKWALAEWAKKNVSEAFARRMNYGSTGYLENLNADTILDPNLASLVRENYRDSGTMHSWSSVLRVCAELGLDEPTLPDTIVWDKSIRQVKKDYPMLGLDRYSYGNADHLTEYVNAMWLARQIKPPMF